VLVYTPDYREKYVKGEGKIFADMKRLALLMIQGGGPSMQDKVRLDGRLVETTVGRMIVGM
jgi:hypothetical protein